MRQLTTCEQTGTVVKSIVSGIEATITGGYYAGFIVREKGSDKPLYLPFNNTHLFEVVE